VNPARRLLAVLFSATALAGVPFSAHAWGDDGHRIVGHVVEQLVQPRVRERMRAILDTDTSGLTRDTSIAEETTWADKYRDSDRQDTRVGYAATGPWHYVDIELDAPDMNAACYFFPDPQPGQRASEGPARDCIVHKIEQFSAELSDSKTPPMEQLRALQYLLHFVADVHQPLHAGEDHDRGGNDKWIRGPVNRRADLHYYWDTWLVHQLGSQPEETVEQVLALARGPERASWERGGAREWAWESYRLARDAVYAPLPKPGSDGQYTLDAGYLDPAQAVVRIQLARASVRLALVLDRALGMRR
jgi:hypothetical protein